MFAGVSFDGKGGVPVHIGRRRYEYDRISQPA
jgi:hypothetical protein